MCRVAPCLLLPSCYLLAMSRILRKELCVRKRLTDRFVRTVKPTATQADYWDQTLIGFGLRVSPKRKRSFQILYRHHRRQRRMVLGSFPAMSLAEARKYAKQMLADAQKGAYFETIPIVPSHVSTN